ncbi:unnamed protein product [Lactuca virosa]|uniref:Uncharacterized protein n=1 Tax=Lactuca virosa TaxID=75947 RepID=A0AAU9MMF5_9ASTR|nr:unnamed protein product [Lactuca virosa]
MIPLHDSIPNLLKNSTDALSITLHITRNPQTQPLAPNPSSGLDHSPNHDDFYTLHSEDQLPLCPTGGYNGIKAVQFPCSRAFTIVGSCDGIFCLSEYQKGISLWNPSIRRKQSLPDYPGRTRCIFSIGPGFGFEPSTIDMKMQ